MTHRALQSLSITRCRGFTYFETAIVTALVAVVGAIAWTFLARTTDAMQYGFQVNSIDATIRKVVAEMSAELKDSGTSIVDPGAIPPYHSPICYHATSGESYTIYVSDWLVPLVVWLPSITDGECPGPVDPLQENLDTHPVWQTSNGSRVEFQRRVAFDGAATDWSTKIAFDLIDSPGETAGNGIDDDGDGVVDERMLVRIQDGITVRLADGVTELDFGRVQEEHEMSLTITISARGLEEGEELRRRRSTRIAFRNAPR